MQQMTGTCIFCKQMAAVHSDDRERFPYKSLDGIATYNCNCDEARKQRRKDNACEALDKMFTAEDDEKLKELFIAAVDIMCDDMIDSATFKLGNTKVGIKLTSNGRIRINKTTSKNEGSEV